METAERQSDGRKVPEAGACFTIHCRLFYCPALQLVVEVDGSTHLEETVALNDKERQDQLEAAGITILRYADGDIRFRLSSVLEGIEEAIRALAAAKGVELVQADKSAFRS